MSCHTVDSTSISLRAYHIGRMLVWNNSKKQKNMIEVIMISFQRPVHPSGGKKLM